jgi:hypothetical protein
MPITGDQIICVLREHEAGVKTSDRCRKHGISDATFHNSKTEYGGMTVSEAARLRTRGMRTAIACQAQPRYLDQPEAPATRQHAGRRGTLRRCSRSRLRVGLIERSCDAYPLTSLIAAGEYSASPAIFRSAVPYGAMMKQRRSIYLG